MREIGGRKVTICERQVTVSGTKEGYDTSQSELKKARENGENVTSFRGWPLWPATWVGHELGGSAPH